MRCRLAANCIHRMAIACRSETTYYVSYNDNIITCIEILAYDVDNGMCVLFFISHVLCFAHFGG